MTNDPFMVRSQQNMMQMVIGAAVGVVGVFVVSLGAMISNWHYVRRCEDEAAQELGTVKTIAYRDPMTGVKSKHAFVEIESELDAAIDLKNAGDFAVLVCDVNGLKYINDTFGHKAGDQYIKEASSLICESFKHSPVYRVGGDEFVVLLNGQDYPERQSLMAAFDRQIEENLTCGKVVISTGMSDYDAQHDNSFHAVFNRADKLMYERKQQLKSQGAVMRD